MFKLMKMPSAKRKRSTVLDKLKIGRSNQRSTVRAIRMQSARWTKPRTVNGTPENLLQEELVNKHIDQNPKLNELTFNRLSLNYGNQHLHLSQLRRNNL
jgi:hypothetical protein